ncbi:MAG TPA: SAM-dependent methyltransferase [Azospirillum sp.]|nr:SAM-dependent methyltransferase [Azospirillum sp.]
MASLARDLRRNLETKVREARVLAEVGARKALERLGVHLSASPGYLTDQEKKLRAKLRAHAKRLGDERRSDGSQDIKQLVPEVAYEHWHRMLFARFLAENDLLIDDGLALTLADVQELAREQGKDWLDLAAGYAQRMLPEIFRTEDPALALALPPETRSALEDRLKALPPAVFQADDSLGWVYQFWRTDEKERVNKSGGPIGADELPAVTQLFTEDYMVLFLLHNTLGAWWAGKVLSANPALAARAADEAELRAACVLPGVEWTYLRFVRETREDGSEGGWRPAAGTFPGWPGDAKDITVLDPCMGSGHFLVFALPILAALRMAEEGLNRKDAVLAVLRDNLYGLEIDYRCTQIAAFNLAFAAWRLISEYVKPPVLHLACSGLAIGMPKQEFLKLADKVAQAVDPQARADLLGAEATLLNAQVDSRIRTGLSRLYDLFEKAPVLGSLIDPRRAGSDLFAADWDLLEPILTQALADGSDEVAEMAVAAQGLAKAAELLAKRYVLVATNVPYLGRGKQSDLLRNWIDEHYPRSKNDIATVFMERLLEMIVPNGTFGTVAPDNWLFLPAYRDLRKTSLIRNGLDICALLGPAAFQDMNWWAARTGLFAMSRRSNIATSHINLIDAGENKSISVKEAILSGQEGSGFTVLPSSTALVGKDSRLDLQGGHKGNVIGHFARASQGLKTGDDDRLVRSFWEIPALAENWHPMQSTSQEQKNYGGQSNVIWWADGGSSVARRQGTKAWRNMGVSIGQMRLLPATIYGGEIFDSNVCVLIPNKMEHVSALLCFAHSGELTRRVRKIEPGSKVNNGTFELIPFDLAHWQKVAAEKYPDGLPKPHSDDPTQWLFNGHPVGSDDPLQVAVARLLGYRWPRQTGSSFMDCPALTEPDGLEPHADTDGIVCLSPVKGEAAAAERLSALLASAYGADWTPQRLTALLSDASDGKARDLSAYLRDHFFKRHVELFQNRPFIWHVWDGRQDGFHALVNYHKLAAPDGEGRRTLEKLVYTYLREWIDRCRTEVKAGAEGAEGRLAAAEHLRGRLEAILEGEPPYDIFVRWKPLRRQAIGWEPDVNDGVRMNIRPFLTARPLDAKSATACILRVTPRIKWDKDRGKEPTRPKDDYPWFWGWDQKTANFAGGPEFDGQRWNDLHYNNDAKRAARGRKGTGQ